MFLSSENVPHKNANPAIHAAIAWIPGITASVGMEELSAYQVIASSFIKSEPAYDTVFQALVDIRKNLDEKINLLDAQIRSAQLQCLEEIFQQQKDVLADCVDGIDQELVKLSVYLEEYWHLYASFNDLNRKISGLGGAPLALPEPLLGDSLAAVLAGRVDILKSQARI